MTDNRQPQALRLAEQYDYGDPATHGNAWKAAVCTELRRQHARIAELEAARFAYASEFEPNGDGYPDVGSIHANIRTMKAQLDSIRAGGVSGPLIGQPQAGAVPQGWKAVPVNPTPEMWKAAKSVPDPNPPYPPHYGLVWDAMLAASPTPTAEQAAPKAAPSEGGDETDWYHGITEKHFDRAVQKAVQRDRASRAAAPKAAPVVWLSSKQLRGVTALHGQYLPFRCQPEGRFDTPVYLVEAATKAAPQQEAQEPVALSEAIERMADDRYKVVPSHESMFHRWAVVAGTGTQQLYLGREAECQNMARKFAGAFLDGAFVAMQQAAPQPAPAPLSEDTERLREALQRIEGASMSMYATRSDMLEHCQDIARAALAAHGGK